MATVRTNSYKNVNGDYTINTSNTGGAGYGNLYINGNLIVSGASANVIPAEITESFITVAANNTGAVHNMGLLAQTGGGSVTGTQTFAGIRFNTDVNQWQLSANVLSDGSPASGNAYLTIATGNVQVAGNNTQLQFNNGGDFGGAANLAYIINGGENTGNTSILTINGLEKFVNIGLSAQGNVVYAANSTYLFSNPAQSGGTGLYFRSPDPANPSSDGIADELISKTKAIVYSIIF